MDGIKRCLTAFAVVLSVQLAQAESIAMGAFTPYGSDVDYTVSDANESGFTMTYADSSDERVDCAARSAASAVFTQVGDKLIYTCTYDSIAVSTNLNYALRSGFDFGSSACIHFITGYGDNTDARIHYNDNGNPFSSGVLAGEVDFGFTSNKTSLAFSTGNTIDATFELTLTGMQDGSYDYDLDVTYSSATETNTLSRTITNLLANTMDGIYHLTNTRDVQIAGDTWSVSNASLNFEPYVVPPQFTLAYAEIGSDADSIATNLSATGATHEYGSDTDGKYDTGIQTTIDGAAGVTITNLGDKLVYSFEYKDLVVTPNNNGAYPMRVGFDFGSTACLMHRTAVGSQADLAFYANNDGNPFSTGSQAGIVSGWSDFAHRTIRFDDGNTIFGTVSLTLKADHGDGTYDYLYEVEYIGSAAQNSASQLFTGVEGNTVASIFHLSNLADMCRDGDQWTVSNVALTYEPYVPALEGPQLLTATAKDKAVVLDWEDTPNPDFASYSVYRSEQSGTNYVLVASGLTQSVYTNSGLINGTTYYFVVTATDTSFEESGYGNEASATPAFGALIKYDLSLLEDGDTGAQFVPTLTYVDTNYNFIVKDPSDDDGRMDRKYFRYSEPTNSKLQIFGGSIYLKGYGSGFSGSDVLNTTDYEAGAWLFNNSVGAYYLDADTILWCGVDGDESANDTPYNDMSYAIRLTDNGVAGTLDEGDVVEIVGIVYSTGTESVFGKTADELTAVLDQSIYEGWSAGFGLFGADAADDFDYDGDGLDNLGEYAFGGNPTNPESMGEQPAVIMDGGALKYVYRIVADSSVNHQVVTSTDLVDGSGSIAVTPLSTNEVAGYNIYTNSVDTSVEPQGFIHVEVSYQ